MNRPDPLTPEERELARLLGRPGTSAPSARVDEAVLAAARAAAAPESPVASAPGRPTHPPVRTHRRRSRLPTILGVAASVVFAVGIAWQLKFDDPDMTPPPEAISVASDAATGPAAEHPPQKPAAQEQAVEAQAVEKRSAGTPAIAERAPPPAAAPAAPKPQALDIAPAPPPAPAAYVTAPPPPAPLMAEEAPAPAAAASAAPIPQERTELDRVVVTGSRIAQDRIGSADSARSAAPPAALRAQRAAPAAAKAAPSAMSNAQPADAVISAAVEADALLPRRQWLDRIRERRDAGDHDTARASLERYLQQYPEVRVPRDLRPLLED